MLDSGKPSAYEGGMAIPPLQLSKSDSETLITLLELANYNFGSHLGKESFEELRQKLLGHIQHHVDPSLVENEDEDDAESPLRGAQYCTKHYPVVKDIWEKSYRQQLWGDLALGWFYSREGKTKEGYSDDDIDSVNKVVDELVPALENKPVEEVLRQMFNRAREGKDWP